jgi:hypothetical protein
MVFVPERHFCGVSQWNDCAVLGHSAKNQESGIWLKIGQKLCDSINWDSTPLIIPDFSHSRECLGKNWFPRFLENSRFFLSLPTHSQFSPRIPDSAFGDAFPAHECHSGSMYVNVCQCNNAMTMLCAATVLHFTMVKKCRTICLRAIEQPSDEMCSNLLWTDVMACCSWLMPM